MNFISETIESVFVFGFYCLCFTTIVNIFQKYLQINLLLIISLTIIIEGRRPLGRLRRRWEDNIKMDLWEIGFGDVDWIHLAQDRDRWRALVNSVMNLRVP
jgi:cytochrome c biogenesis protein CcdA